MLLQRQYESDDGWATTPPRARRGKVAVGDRVARVQLLIPNCDRANVEIPYWQLDGAPTRKFNVLEYAPTGTWSFDLSRLAIAPSDGIIAARVFCGEYELGGGIVDFANLVQISQDPLILSSTDLKNTPLVVRLYSEAKIETSVAIKFRSAERKVQDDESIVVVRSEWDLPRAFHVSLGCLRPMWAADLLEVVTPQPETAPVSAAEAQPAVSAPVVVDNGTSVMSITVTVSVPRGQPVPTVAVAPVAPVVVTPPVVVAPVAPVPTVVVAPVVVTDIPQVVQ